MFFLFGICNQHMQASHDKDAIRQKEENEKKMLTKDDIIEEYNKLEEQKKNAKKFQRDAYHVYNIETSLIKQEKEEEDRKNEKD